VDFLYCMRGHTWRKQIDLRRGGLDGNGRTYLERSILEDVDLAVMDASGCLFLLFGVGARAG